MALKENVKFLREQKKMSQAELAKALKKGQATIQKIESGKTDVPRFLDKIAQFFEVSEEMLLFGDLTSQQEFSEKIRDPVGQRLQEIKDYLLPHLTNEKIADWYELSPQAVQKWTTTGIPKRRIDKFCERTGISKEWLILGTGQPFAENKNPILDLETLYHSSGQASFARRVWRNLSSLEARGLGENKPEEMAWAAAWALLMECYPESDISDIKEEKRDDGTMTIKTSITIKEGDNSLTRTMWLPVKNQDNEIIRNPDAGQIHDSTMLCLVKCLNLFGLGMNFCTK